MLVDILYLYAHIDLSITISSYFNLWNSIAAPRKFAEAHTDYNALAHLCSVDALKNTSHMRVPCGHAFGEYFTLPGSAHPQRCDRRLRRIRIDSHSF